MVGSMVGASPSREVTCSMTWVGEWWSGAAVGELLRAEGGDRKCWGPIVGWACHLCRAASHCRPFQEKEDWSDIARLARRSASELDALGICVIVKWSKRSAIWQALRCRGWSLGQWG